MFTRRLWPLLLALMPSGCSTAEPPTQLSGKAIPAMGLYVWPMGVVTDAGSLGAFSDFVDHAAYGLGGMVIADTTYVLCKGYPSSCAEAQHTAELATFVDTFNQQGVHVALMFANTQFNAGDPVKPMHWYNAVETWLTDSTTQAALANTQALTLHFDVEIKEDATCPQYSDATHGDFCAGDIGFCVPCAAEVNDYFDQFDQIRTKIKAWNASSPNLQLRLSLYTPNGFFWWNTSTIAGLKYPVGYSGGDNVLTAACYYSDNIVQAVFRSSACNVGGAPAKSCAAPASCLDTIPGSAHTYWNGWGSDCYLGVPGADTCGDGIALNAARAGALVQALGATDGCSVSFTLEMNALENGSCYKITFGRTDYWNLPTETERLARLHQEITRSIGALDASGLNFNLTQDPYWVPWILHDYTGLQCYLSQGMVPSCNGAGCRSECRDPNVAPYVSGCSKCINP